MRLQIGRVGQVDGGAVQADQPAAAIPGTLGAGLGERARHAGEQLLERGGPEPGSCLGDGRLVGQGESRAAPVQPAHALEQAAQDLAIGGLGIKRQGHDVVDHQPGRQLPLTPALPAGIGQHGVD
jgi:hypothetical protein